MDLKQLGWNEYFASQNRDQPVGRVAFASREQFLVWTERGEIEASVSGHLRHAAIQWPCVGDWVVLRDSVITDVLHRRTELSRREPGKEIRAQVLAANIDIIFVVSGLDRDYNPRRLERYLVLAHESGARPVLLLNKADLRSDLEMIVDETRRLASGCPVVALSALEGWGIEGLASFVAFAETAALIGSSGAGKSTILNRLLGEERQPTTPVREADSRGRHTTSHRQLMLMNEGWLLMDLPGLRELQLWADPEQIDKTFADIAELARRCKFRDCSHEHEPGCAVRAANMDEERLAGYHKLRRELAYLDRQLDPTLAREIKRRSKLIERSIRRHPKYRR